MATKIGSGNDHASKSGTTPSDEGFRDLAKPDPSDAVHLSDTAKQLLQLYDEHLELRLERTLLEAQVAQDAEMDVDLPAGEAEPKIKEAERECLEARAKYLLKHSIVEDVLCVDPSLKALHSGANATPTEKALHPIIDRRDTLSIAEANLSANLQPILNAHTLTEAENIKCIAQNRELAATLFSLTDQLEGLERASLKNPEYQAQLESIKNEMRELRGKRRIIKSVVSAIVAGSGVDWARDDELRGLVLNDED